MSDIETRLAERGLTLPPAPAPAANYMPFVVVGDLVHVSGQISMRDGEPLTGKLGDSASIEDGVGAAQSCALALLAQVKAACDGDLTRLARVVKLTGFVNATPDFTGHPQVINGASDLIGDVLGEAGRHARAAVGAGSLPLGVMVEIEGLFQIR